MKWFRLTNVEFTTDGTLEAVDDVMVKTGNNVSNREGFGSVDRRNRSLLTKTRTSGAFRVST